jgi:F-type H+-transporting ATPase subunit b
MIDLNATLLVQMVNFFIFLFILRKILFNPLVEHIQSRRNYLSSTEEKIAQALAKIEQADKQYQAQLDDARQKAQEVITNQIAMAEQEKQSIIKAAIAETRKVFDEFSKELADETKKVRNELDTEVEALAREISSKVLALNISDEKILVQGGNQ